MFRRNVGGFDAGLRRVLKIFGYAVGLAIGLVALGGGLFALEVFSREPLATAPSTIHPALGRRDCLGCHEPIAEELREPRGIIPAARADDAELGVDCTSCHVSTRGILGSGQRRTAEHETIADRRFQAAAVTSNELCRTCHRATVEAWNRTTLPAAGITCLDCHMPEVRAVSVSGGAERRRRSHRFVADKDEETLKRALNASLTITPDGQARLRIVNDRVGHYFPSGGNWLLVDFRAHDPSGRVLAEKREGIGREVPLVLDFWPFNGDRRIPFGGQRDVVFPLPEGSGTVAVEVRYHDWMRKNPVLLTLKENY